MTDIILPWPESKLVGHSKHHWRIMRPVIAKHREWATNATKASLRHALEGKSDIRIAVTFYPPHRRGDRVNYPNMIKPYWDGIADALKVNDRRFHPSYHFAEPVKDARVVFSVIEMADF